MKPQQVEFLRRLARECPPERRSAIALELVRTEGLGRVEGSRVLYGAADHARAAKLLGTRGFALSAPAPGFARSEAPAGGSEKTGARAVTQDLVAVIPLGLDWRVPPGGFLALPWQSAAALAHEVLLVVENLEAFLQVRDFAWLAEFIRGRPTLVLFRGMVHCFGTEAAARLIDHDQRPTLAFFDFDPKGLAMAAALPRREALCLPPWPLLEPAVRAARRDHLFGNSAHGSCAQLDREQDSQIALAWQRMKLLAMGLNQEGFPRGVT